MVRYQLKSPGDKYRPAADKYVERNVRSLALVMTVEEREDLNKEGGDVLYNPVEENSEIIENILLKDQKLVSFD